MRIEDADRWDFETPPVVETILGVYFDPLAGWGVPHFGLYWAGARDEYPSFEVRGPLAAPAESPRVHRGPLEALIRCLFFARDGAGLIQVQRDCFIRNWKKRDDAGGYPRYDRTRPLFETEWVRFCAFLAGEGIDLPEPKSCEVTYVNHIPRGRVHPGDLFPGLGLASAELPAPDSVDVSVHYPIAGDRGHVSVSVQSATCGADQAPIYQLMVTARGTPAESDLSGVLNWFDVGRNWAKLVFINHTSHHLHREWGLSERSPS
ncbi:MAG: TIGR04255 family protein [Gemmataceae bacterium]